MAETSSELAVRLTQQSREQFWNVYTEFQWPEKLEGDRFAMTPELVSIHGTELWNELTKEQQIRLSLYEIGNFFSLTLQGERPLVAGLSDRLYSSRLSSEGTEYIHHFIDEENKHMIMFGAFCRKYVGRVYPDKRLAMPAKYAPGEELLRFYTLAMVVEAYGDYFNVRVMSDDRCNPLVRAISRVHHVDEARHIAFDKAYLAELAAEHMPGWDDETRRSFQQWLAGFMKANWLTFYNPAAYRDAGIENPYEVQKIAMAAPGQKALREKVTASVANFFLQTGLVAELPEV